ncbi:uncharacterized protein LOC135213265 [Macrobrachium nipponense]|uniref:uncharacterized protein LOC135213265 n=1 Tax=Macrobrachium nipponense TaxID=159736 RepID=UPI0030C87575
METELHKVKAGELRVGVASTTSELSNSLAKLPKLPSFDESKDCIDSYLQRFASNARWDSSSWAINLSALLQGKALEVYSRLPVSEALDYNGLKQALLKRFQLTEEGFHSKFRSCKPDQGESPSQFLARLDNYVEKWLNLSGGTRSYEGLKDLFLREQFMNSCSKPLSMFLKERHPKNVDEMSNLADQFIEAHGYSSFTKDSQAFQKLSLIGNSSRGASHNGQLQMQYTDPLQRRPFLQSQLDQCKSNSVNTNGGSLLQQHKKTGQRNKVYQDVSMQEQSQIGSACLVTSILMDCCVTDGQVRLACGHVLPVIGGACKIGTVRTVEEASIDIDTPFYTGKVNALCMKEPVYDLIIGNLEGARNHLDPDEQWCKRKNQKEGSEVLQSVVTRGQAIKNKQGMKALNVAGGVDVEVSVNKMKELQAEDKTLGVYRNYAISGKRKVMGDGIVTWFTVEKGLLYRLFQSPKVSNNKLFKQLIVPESLRQKVMSIAHDSILGGHLGAKKTLDHYSTRYPEAVPLKGIETEQVAEALVQIFSRVGIPKEILSDMGTQFTSNLMKEVGRLLSVKQLVTTPYHPACNGLVERFNGTLKTMLRKMSSERPKDWDRYLPALLFAYRGVPQESTGFSPFELLYGRTVRGPMTVLKELWTKEETMPDVKSTYQYVIDLKERLSRTCELAQKDSRNLVQDTRNITTEKQRLRLLRWVIMF